MGNNGKRVEIEKRDCFHYDFQLLSSDSFKSAALFFLFHNPFLDPNSLVIQREKNPRIKQEEKEGGDLHARITTIFGRHYHPKITITVDDEEWHDPAISKDFTKTVYFEFAYFQKIPTMTSFASFCIHLRNAFAHGGFMQLKTSTVNYWFFQDVKDGKLAARICISQPNLNQIINDISSLLGMKS